MFTIDFWCSASITVAFITCQSSSVFVGWFLQTSQSCLTHLPLWWLPSQWSTLLGLLGSRRWRRAGRWARCTGWGGRLCPAPSGRCHCRSWEGCSSRERWSALCFWSRSTRWSDPVRADPAKPATGLPVSTCTTAHSRGQRSHVQEYFTD